MNTFSRMDRISQIVLMSSHLRSSKQHNLLNNSSVLQKPMDYQIPLVKTVSSIKLNEAFTRRELIDMGKYSTKVGTVDQELADMSLDEIPCDFNEKRFIDSSVLEFKFKIHQYTITLEFYNIVKCFKSMFKDKGPYNYKLRCTNLSKALDLADVKINCTCKDFTDRLAYNATVKGFKAGAKVSTSNDSANIKSVKGSGCKHIMKILSNKVWLSRFYTQILYAMNDKVDLYDRRDIDTETQINSNYRIMRPSQPFTKLRKKTNNHLKEQRYSFATKSYDDSLNESSSCNRSNQCQTVRKNSNSVRRVNKSSLTPSGTYNDLLEKALLYKKNNYRTF